jgi:serine/threonine protein phosphatase PrpC
MSDPMIVAAALALLAATGAVGYFGRAPRRAPSGRPPSKPESPSIVPRLDDELAVTNGASVAADAAPTRRASAPEISPLLAEALAEADEAYGASEPSPEPPRAALLRRKKASFIFQGGAEQDEPTGPLARVQIEAIGDTDCGRRRARNEDALLLLPEQGLFAVADGMGGYKGGQVASSLAIESLRRTFESRELGPGVGQGAPRRALEVASAMERANDAVFDAARSQPELREMGTTLVALRFVPNKQRLYVGHVGDSRCYRLRDGELLQLTTDHAMRELGLSGPRANDLFQAIGIDSEVAVDVVVDKPLPGDVYLLCSDGLSKMLADEQIRELLLAEDDTEAAVYGLIEQANDAGGKDNVTVLLAKVSAPSGAHALGGTT